MGQTQVSNGGIQPTILEPIQNLYTGSTIVFTVTVASKDSTHRYNGQGSSNGYKIDGKFAPFIVLTPGITYKFDQADSSNSGHPLRFYKDAAKVTAYTTNVTTNGTAGSSGAYTQIVTGDATPTILYYQCSAHGLMGNAVQTNGLASSVPDDGSITTAKLAADAVNGTKIADDAVDSEHFVDGSIDTAHIADQAVTLDKLPHGTGSNNGKFLRANNGADPSFETVNIPAGTTINNNADNRVITGSGTANTLNGESGFIFDGTKLGIGMTPSSGTGYILQLESGQAQTFMTFGNTGTGNGALNGFVLGNDSTRAYITQRENQNINIATNNIDKMILESDGDLRLSSDNANSNYGFIDGWVASTGDMVIGADQSTTGSGGSNLIFRTRGGEKARILNSGGITFNGDTAADNALDDYEEGNFTPAYQGTWTNISNSQLRHAEYTKIGNIVHIWMEYFITGNNGEYGNDAYIENLPFTGTSNQNSLYTPVNIAIMYGPGGFSMDSNAAGRSYISAADDRLYLRMGTYNGIRHIWIQATYKTNY